MTAIRPTYTHALTADEITQTATMDIEATQDLFRRIFGYYPNCRGKRTRTHVIKSGDIQLSIELPENVKLTVRSVSKLTGKKLSGRTIQSP